MQAALNYRNILVAIDFSPYSEAALNQALWVARHSGARIVLAHALPDLMAVVHSASTTAKLDLLRGEGEEFQREIESRTEARLRKLAAGFDTSGLDIRYETYLGKPYFEIPYAVEREKIDLVIAGTRGHGRVAQFLLGSTAKRLIRKCPCSVWVVKTEHVGPPKSVLAATDFSDVSRRAVLEGLAIAQQSGAIFHLVHVIESLELPDEVIERFPDVKAVRERMADEAHRSLQEFVESLNVDASLIKMHQPTAVPWDEIRRLVKELSIDLVSIGTVGRSGVPRLLLGNTAEKILDHCDSSILTTKAADFVSPLAAAG
jgi:nucleotide-binding universal stress UspA family protein